MRFLAFLAILCLCGPAAADIVTFQDSKSATSFSYDDRLWQSSDHPGPGELIRIERHILGGDKIAICRLRAKKTTYATRIEGHLHQEREKIVSRMLESDRRRDPEVPYILSSPVTVGSQQMIELRQYPKDGSADVPNGMVVIGLYTVYRGQEIMFQCGYPGHFKPIDGKEPYVEPEIRAVMKTLSFDN